MLRWLTLPLWWPLWLLRALWLQRSKCDTLVLKLSGSLPDTPVTPNPLRRLLGARTAVDLPSLLLALRVARHDQKLVRVVVKLEELTLRLGRAEELRVALRKLADTPGKEVVVYAEQLSLSGYWVALGGSRIVMPSAGHLNVSGVGLTFTLLRGLLDHAGVRAQMLAQGKYKSMREMFTEKQISEANREAMQGLVESLEGRLLERIATARSLPKDSLPQLLAQGPFTAAQAQEAGLLDAPAYAGELEEELELRRRGQTAGAYCRKVRRRRLWPRRAKRVGLLTISGSIRHGQGRPGPSGSPSVGNRDVELAVRRAIDDKHLLGVVVRIDSPGGSALASDLMWHALRRLAKEKPVVVSMGDMAASGGYYAAGIEGAQIWANPTTITGSIGVVGGKLCVADLLAKLGIGRTPIANSPRAHFYDPSQPWSPEDLEKLQRDMRWLYDDFVQKMAKARGLTKEELHAVAQGRVWTGEQAKQHRLVDHLGGLEQAVDSLAEKVGVAPSDVALVPMGRRRSWRPASTPDEGFSVPGSPEARFFTHLVRLLGPEVAASLEQTLALEGERLLLLSPSLNVQ